MTNRPIHIRSDEPDDPLDRSQRDHIVSDIERHGWCGVLVAAHPTNAAMPEFEYTVGLMETLNHPEVVLFGLPSEVSHHVLWWIAKDIRSGRRFAIDERLEGVLNDAPCVFRNVRPSQHPVYLGYAMWRRRVLGQIGDLGALQCFWPDKDGSFPWEPSCDASCRAVQPRLDLPAADDPYGLEP